ncbi:unnamed protein product [Haemonchus placei]|uniref:G_PROTEIN_RECEP_F1_2 domain-containing protein n=1 Tax=Haemonchus placei TaxID=6290 RepID=A0A0N4WSG4_HAEPC|nr:unnamed protein product [Haemonchus placei]
MIHAQKKNAANLTSSFFKLCIATGLTDIVTLLNNYFGAVFPKWGWFTSVYMALGKPYAYTYLIIAWASGFNQAVSVSMLAINRLSAILFPQRYQQFWCGRRLKIAIAIQIIPGFIVSLLNLTNDVALSGTENGGLVPVILESD